jgi:hypothetical protein
MPFKPNYRQERAQRARSKESKQQEKLLRREEAAAKRKALREGEPGSEAENGTPPSDGPAKPSEK